MCNLELNAEKYHIYNKPLIILIIWTNWNLTWPSGNSDHAIVYGKLQTGKLKNSAHSFNAHMPMKYVHLHQHLEELRFGQNIDVPFTETTVSNGAKKKKKKRGVCAHVSNLYSWWDRHSNRSLAVKCGSMEAIWNTEQVFYFVCLFFFLHPTYTPLNRTLLVRVTNTPALWNWLFRY